MSKRTSIRIPDALYVQIVQRAEREHRTVSNLIIALLSEATQRDNVAQSVAQPTQGSNDTASECGAAQARKSTG